ncbi:nitrilase-related carbon-nitrogen hydrolase [Cystobacter fuscus]
MVRLRGQLGLRAPGRGAPRAARARGVRGRARGHPRLRRAAARGGGERGRARAGRGHHGGGGGGRGPRGGAVPAHPGRGLRRRGLAGLRRGSGAANEELLRLSAREAERGAKLILWSEGNAVVLAGQLPALLSRGSALARERSVWLGMAVASLEPSAERLLRNELILVGPDGNVAWRYVKARPVPGWEADHSIPGSPEVPVLKDSGVGNVGGAICFDGDFPAQFAGSTARGLELLLLPASDWRSISALHMRQAVFRAVEQGFSMLRQANQGTSVAVDGYGRVYGEMDHFTAEERVLRAGLPVGRVPTLYARIGDAVGALSGLVALGWVLWAVVGGLARRWRARERLHAQPGA